MWIAAVWKPETHLNVMVLGASDNQVLAVSRLIHSQAHNWTKVTSKLSSRGKPNAGKEMLMSLLLNCQANTTGEMPK